MTDLEREKMMNLKQVDLSGALEAVKNPNAQVLMLVPISADTRIAFASLAECFGFAVAEEEQNAAAEPEEKEPEKPKEKKQKVDHGKIIALYRAGWNISSIALECTCSTQTVRNHIEAEEKNDSGAGES